MDRKIACRTILITVCVLLMCTTLGSAQSGKRRQQDPRDITVVPAAPITSPAERRVALVIGNGQYHHVPRLANPTNDARLIAETLTSVGFTLIGGKAQLDLDKTGFDRMVQEFGTVIQGAGVALFYYAGHGLQVRGANYLVPVSANPIREADVDFQLLNVDLVLRQMEGAGTRLSFLILDACRNNPLTGRGFRTAGGGLAQIQAPEGTLISYATQPGNVALDGTDGHSPYTRALASAVKKPGLDVFAVFNETGLEVKKRTGGAQQPWVSSSPIEGTFYFVGALAPQPTITPTPPPAAVLPQSSLGYIPSLEAQVTSLRFCKGTGKIPTELPPRKQREYGQRFSKNISNYYSSNIFWELGLEHPAKSRPINFGIQWSILDEDGKSIYRSSVGSVLLENTSSSYHTGLIFQKLDPGSYRLDIYIDDAIVASNSFEIF